MIDRREMMKRAGMTALATGFGSFPALALDAVTLPIDNGERPLVKYPQKRPMIGLISRPPQLETPFSVFNDGAITPKKALFGVIAPSLKTENGVSSCGGRLVRPIIGRFCGYFTSGRSPLSMGNVTASSSSAGNEPKPVASAAMPARFIISRLSIIGFAPKFFVEAGLHRTPKTCVYSIHKTGIPLGSGPRASDCEIRACASVASARPKSIYAFGDVAIQQFGSGLELADRINGTAKRNPGRSRRSGLLNWKKPKFEISIRRR